MCIRDSYSDSYNNKNFRISENAENIFTYTERLRGLIESQIQSKHKFVEIESSIQRFVNLTTVYKDLYGSYDYYNYLSNFLEPLYELNMEKGRTLYNDISLEILNRLSLLKSSKNSTNKEYIESLIEDEIYNYKDLINSISDFESESFLSQEINKLNELID